MLSSPRSPRTRISLLAGVQGLVVLELVSSTTRQCWRRAIIVYSATYRETDVVYGSLQTPNVYTHLGVKNESQAKNMQTWKHGNPRNNAVRNATGRSVKQGSRAEILEEVYS